MSGFMELQDKSNQKSINLFFEDSKKTWHHIPHYTKVHPGRQSKSANSKTMDHPNHHIAGREEDWTGGLMDQVCALEALKSGYRKVKRNSKKTSKRHQAIENFGKQLDKRLTEIRHLTSRLSVTG
jgi:hypothetical protein